MLTASPMARWSEIKAIRGRTEAYIGQCQSGETRAEDALLCDRIIWEGVTHSSKYEG